MIKNIGNKIKTIREIHGFSQEYVADKINISNRAYSKIENEVTQLTIARLNEISAVYGICPIKILSSDFSSPLVEKIEQQPANIPNIDVYKNLLDEKDRLICEKDKVISFLEKEVRMLKESSPLVKE